jgi:hypothetical protein
VKPMSKVFMVISDGDSSEVAFANVLKDHCKRLHLPSDPTVSVAHNEDFPNFIKAQEFANKLLESEEKPRPYTDCCPFKYGNTQMFLFFGKK